MLTSLCIVESDADDNDDGAAPSPSWLAMLHATVVVAAVVAFLARESGVRVDNRLFLLCCELVASRPLLRAASAVLGSVYTMMRSSSAAPAAPADLLAKALRRGGPPVLPANEKLKAPLLSSPLVAPPGAAPPDAPRLRGPSLPCRSWRPCPWRPSPPLRPSH